MNGVVPKDITVQISEARNVIERHLVPNLLSVHLFGSAVDGGLKTYSDIDLFVTIAEPPIENVRRTLMRDLLKISAPPGESKILRALEVTVVIHNEVVPWHYPATRELQFGEWKREDILEGIFEASVIDPDLAILLTQLREKSIALIGPPAEHFFDAVPVIDFYKVMSDTLGLWNLPSDWLGDERNVLLTLARIWISSTTGKIAPKHVAADWAIEHLPIKYQPIMIEARQAYLGHREDRLVSRGDQILELIHYMKRTIGESLVGASDT
ncbi:AadA family aminoglycoside 3''-O-nucleotidyltransferase [Nitrosomonas marina]|uniref:Aminoglycoside (3'') (9) adenylyltransferase n=1 Tax=Nitrosomonas marina TaxID=917 RepID=A0A1H8ILG4_9PROT|nr:AadA family aminoglycoside 3''-O-nucleotidyltransferase [Nitrosomonas marina]SEN69172.1 streptomycin 3-adenylyltransferase [Nitrosomonas marina]